MYKPDYVFVPKTHSYLRGTLIALLLVAAALAVLAGSGVLE